MGLEGSIVALEKGFESSHKMGDKLAHSQWCITRHWEHKYEVTIDTIYLFKLKIWKMYPLVNYF